MTRPSAALARLEDDIAALVFGLRHALRRRAIDLACAALMLGVAAEIWIGVLRSAALYTTP